MKVFGLTGGIGSGKSAAALCFQESGIPVIDADQKGHTLLKRPDLRDALCSALGATVLDKGEISREKLAELVFADGQVRKTVNHILHPAIMTDISRECASLFEEGNAVVMVEAALLGDDGKLPPLLSGLVLVLCPEEQRIQRLMHNRNMRESEAKKRIAAQVPPESKLDIAAWIVNNDGDWNHLRAQVERVAESIRGLSG